MSRFLSLLLALLASAPIFAGDKTSVSVTPVSQDPDAVNGGVIYALPKTVVRVKLTARAVVSTAGPFFKYSTRCLNLSDVVTENSTRWSLVSAEVSTVGVPDYSQRFKVSVSDVSLMPAISLSDCGVLLSVNGESDYATPAESATAVVPAYANFDDVQVPHSVIARTSTAAMAEECANVIYALRDSRIDLISGDKNVSLPDAGAYKRALSEIDRQEAQLVSLFAGRRDTVFVERFVDIYPDENGSSNVVPVRFSESTGFVEATDLSGKPVYVDLEYADVQALNAFPDGSKQRKAAPVDGLRYYVPAVLLVRVSDRNIPLCQCSVRCSQTASVASLPAALLLSHRIVLNPADGSLVSISPK